MQAWVDKTPGVIRVSIDVGDRDVILAEKKRKWWWSPLVCFGAQNKRNSRVFSQNTGHHFKVIYSPRQTCAEWAGFLAWGSRPSGLREPAFWPEGAGLLAWVSRPSGLSEPAFWPEWAGLLAWVGKLSGLSEPAFWPEWAGFVEKGKRISGLSESIFWPEETKHQRWRKVFKSNTVTFVGIVQNRGSKHEFSQ